ncbi:MAG: hypothetical protein NVSMB6_05800 [Burkholderiaceae bacterium]
MTVDYGQPSVHAQAVLKALQDAVNKDLERKKRLGQYSVTWQDGRPAIVGEDAPKVPGGSGV